ARLLADAQAGRAVLLPARVHDRRRRSRAASARSLVRDGGRHRAVPGRRCDVDAGDERPRSDASGPDQDDCRAEYAIDDDVGAAKTMMTFRAGSGATLALALLLLPGRPQ